METRTLRRRLAAPFACLLLLLATTARGADKLALADGDRVVFLGSTFVERDQLYGYLETLLVSRFPDRSFTWRNVGWSGDTVFGDARAEFNSPKEGYGRMVQQIGELRPTVLLICYGMNESFAGEAGLPAFAQGLRTLLDDLTAATHARVVLISPNRHEDRGRPLPDPAAHNRDLSAYTGAISREVVRRGCGFVDLFNLPPEKPLAQPLTENGIHYTPYGYWRVAQLLEKGLDFEPRAWRVAIEVAKPGPEPVGTTLASIQPGPRGVTFDATDAMLPVPPAPVAGAKPEFPRTLAVRGLDAGNYELRVDGKPVATASAAEWAAGVMLTRGPEFDQIEQLRLALREKNELYFHRWRPQNDTYIFGFRKREQGQNAVEIPQFDPLIGEWEAKAAALRVPAKHAYALQRAG